MPIMCGLRGWKMMLQGEEVIEREWFPGFWRRLFGPRSRAVKTYPDGHASRISYRDIVLVEHQPLAELKEQEEKAKAQAEAQEKAQKEEAERREKAQAEALAKAAKDFIAEHGPNPGNWPTLQPPKKRIVTFG